jgi:hypothetical protein
MNGSPPFRCLCIYTVLINICKHMSMSIGKSIKNMIRRHQTAFVGHVYI